MILAAFSRSEIPLLHRSIDARTMAADVRRIVETERWNSFDRFHQTTGTLVRAYERNGAATEVYSAPTGGALGNGRWLIQEAADVRDATVEIVAPFRRRLLDYAENPWHVVQWSASTPKEGLRGELAVIDSDEQLQRVSSGALAGKIILTSLNVLDKRRMFCEQGAAAVISDAAPKFGSPLQRGKLDRAVNWTKFGWGGISMQDSPARLVGLAISPAQGYSLRSLAERHGKLTLHLKVDIHRYAGTHDVVSGIVRGRDDPQDEVWAVAHSSEPGALDNASGVAVCIEIAGVLNRLIANGKLPPPRRSIRLLHGYECYGFFHFLEHRKRFQAPLAGVCIDTVGARPDLCEGKLGWHATIPSSAGFVDDVGEALLRASLRIDNAGYTLAPRPFVTTEDTLLGDPKFGFPCPWITNHPFKGYHSSADTPALLHPRGLRSVVAAMAGYLYYLANAASPEVLELAAWQTEKTLRQLRKSRRKPAVLNFLRERHRTNLERLERWMWGGSRTEILAQLSACKKEVADAVGTVEVADLRTAGVSPASLDYHAGGTPAVRPRASSSLIPRRAALLAPTTENAPLEIGKRLDASGIPKWTCYWADGQRTLEQIRELASVEFKRNIAPAKLEQYFRALADLNYVELIEAERRITPAGIVRDLKKIGIRPGMDLIVHSSLSKLGHVRGGAAAVIDALLAVLGPRGTLLMPSFNHFEAAVFNPLATPTTNGAIPDALWRRADAVRSRHPSHALAAIGPKASAWCADHLENGIWAPDSPIGRLVHGGGYILSLGVTSESSTAYHIAEISLNAGCLDQFGSADRAVSDDGTVESVRGLAWRAHACPVHPRKIDETLRRRGLARYGKIGDADSILVKALDVWKIRREHLKDVCPNCAIKPNCRM